MEYRKYFNIACNINCWECKEYCPIRDLMIASYRNPLIEEALYFSIIKTLNEKADIFITIGMDPEAINEEVKFLAVSFYVARLKLFEELQKN